MITLHQNLKCSKCKELKGISDYEDIAISKKLSMGYMNWQPQVKELLIHKDIQGDLLKGFLKSESDSDIKVVYCPEVKKGQVKVWKKHNLQTCNIIVPQAEIRFVIFNDLNKKPFVINISDFECDDSENKIIKLNSINFDWTE